MAVTPAWINLVHVDSIHLDSAASYCVVLKYLRSASYLGLSSRGRCSLDVLPVRSRPKREVHSKNRANHRAFH